MFASRCWLASTLQTPWRRSGSRGMCSTALRSTRLIPRYAGLQMDRRVRPLHLPGSQFAGVVCAGRLCVRADSYASTCGARCACYSTAWPAASCFLCNFVGRAVVLARQRRSCCPTRWSAVQQFCSCLVVTRKCHERKSRHDPHAEFCRTTDPYVLPREGACHSTNRLRFT